MNILFLNSIGRDKFGGGEKWMIKAAKGLSDRGHHVILASRKQSRIVEAAKHLGIRTEIIEIHGDFSPLKTWQIAKFLKKEAIDILICNLNKDVRVAGLAARLIKKPVVLARHGIQLAGNKWRHKLTLTNLADGIITNSKTIKQAYKEYGWFDDNFVRVIYNGIEPKIGIEPFDFKKQFSHKKVIFSAGRLAEQKGFNYFIDAASILMQERQDLAFVIMGEGKLKAELQDLIQQKGIEKSFRIWDYKPNIDPYLKGSDLFVLASLYEGMPNVVMEAMAVGKPVVATDVNGARELMVDGQTGLIVPPKDPQALVGAIQILLDDPAQSQKFGNNGMERVRQEFTIERMVRHLEDYFAEKLAQKQATWL